MVSHASKSNTNPRTCPTCPHTSHSFHLYYHLHTSSKPHLTTPEHSLSLRGSEGSESYLTKSKDQPKPPPPPPKPTVEDIPEPKNSNNGDGKHPSGRDLNPGEVVPVGERSGYDYGYEEGEGESGRNVMMFQKKRGGGEYALRGDQVRVRGGFGGEGDDDRDDDRDDGDDSDDEEENDDGYETTSSMHALQRRNLEYVPNRSTTLDLGAREFYEIMYSGRVEGFSVRPGVVLAEEMDGRNGFSELWLCNGCGGYRVARRESGELVVDGRRILLCEGCGWGIDGEGVGSGSRSGVGMRGGAGDEEVFSRLLEEDAECRRLELRRLKERDDEKSILAKDADSETEEDSLDQFLRFLDELPSLWFAIQQPGGTGSNWLNSIPNGSLDPIEQPFHDTLKRLEIGSQKQEIRGITAKEHDRFTSLLPDDHLYYTGSIPAPDPKMFAESKAVLLVKRCKGCGKEKGFWTEKAIQTLGDLKEGGEFWCESCDVGDDKVSGQRISDAGADDDEVCLRRGAGPASM